MIREINTDQTTHHPRCAVYTRTATIVEDEQINSIESQRNAAELFISEHVDDNWVLLPERYDDEGFSGSTADRPGLKRLLQDVRDGRIDCIVIYSLDRLSRDINGMSEIMLIFSENDVLLETVVKPPVLDKQIWSPNRSLGNAQ